MRAEGHDGTRRTNRHQYPRPPQRGHTRPGKEITRSDTESVDDEVSLDRGRVPYGHRTRVEGRTELATVADRTTNERPPRHAQPELVLTTATTPGEKRHRRHRPMPTRRQFPLGREKPQVHRLVAHAGPTNTACDVPIRTGTRLRSASLNT